MLPGDGALLVFIITYNFTGFAGTASNYIQQPHMEKSFMKCTRQMPYQPQHGHGQVTHHQYSTEAVCDVGPSMSKLDHAYVTKLEVSKLEGS